MKLREAVYLQRALTNMVYKIFDKKTGSGVSVNEQLAEELHKPVIKKIKRRKVYVHICMVKYAWFKSLKDKKGKAFKR